MLRATQTIFIGADDGERTIHCGDLFADDDPIVEGRERLFEPVEVEPAEGKPARARKRPTAKKATGQ
jgi:hypothetical protein